MFRGGRRCGRTTIPRYFEGDATLNQTNNRPAETVIARHENFIVNAAPSQLPGLLSWPKKQAAWIWQKTDCDRAASTLRIVVT
jgi:hypothetical protein